MISRRIVTFLISVQLCNCFVSSSLGFAEGSTSSFQFLVRGEIDELTTLVYDARENALHRLMEPAVEAGADDVVGIKTFINLADQRMGANLNEGKK